MSDDIAPWDSQPADPVPSPAPVKAATANASPSPVAPWDSEPSTARQSNANTPGPRSFGSQVMHEGAQLAKGASNAIAALPLMAMDMGVGARNLFGKVTGIGGTDYEYPSDTWHQGMDQIFGPPENTVEQINDVALPVLMGGAGASARAPAAIRSIMAGPEAEYQAPSNFMTAAQQKKQLLAQTIKNAQDAGLVVPPQTTNPGFVNNAVETVGGKIATQQAASVHNQPIANALAARELGLNPDAPLTEPAIHQVIKEAGHGYEAVRNAGQITVGPKYLQTLSDVASQAAGPAASFPGSKVSPLVGEVDSLLQPSFDASHAVDKIAELRDASSVAYRQGEQRLGQGYRTLARALEDQIDEGISQRPDADPATIEKYRASRVLAAKAHAVADALNSATGDVSISKLAKLDEPLTGNLKLLADFGNAAPKATQDVAKIGSHGVSHLDTLGTLFTSAFGEHYAGPWGVAAGAAYPAARWGARAYALGPGQARALPHIATSAGRPIAAAASTQAAAAAADASRDSDNPQLSRASGGRVDEDMLVNRLTRRWQAAKRATDETTKPLLNVPDAAIIKALDIAQEQL